MAQAFSPVPHRQKCLCHRSPSPCLLPMRERSKRVAGSRNEVSRMGFPNGSLGTRVRQRPSPVAGNKDRNRLPSRSTVFQDEPPHPCPSPLSTGARGNWQHVSRARKRRTGRRLPPRRSRVRLTTPRRGEGIGANARAQGAVQKSCALETVKHCRPFQERVFRLVELT